GEALLAEDEGRSTEAETDRRRAKARRRAGQAAVGVVVEVVAQDFAVRVALDDRDEVEEEPRRRGRLERVRLAEPGLGRGPAVAVHAEPGLAREPLLDRGGRPRSREKEDEDPGCFRLHGRAELILGCSGPGLR